MLNTNTNLLLRFLISFFILFLFSVPARAQYPATATYNFSNCGFPDTGQTLCFDNSYSSGPCPGGFDGSGPYGQDGDYASQLTGSRYTVYNPVGTSSVTVDNRTGLMWEINGGCSGTAVTQPGAITCCNNLVYATFSDWRLPTIRELRSIIYYDVNLPNWIDQVHFSDLAGSYYWSTTLYAPNTLNAWTVYYSNGNVLATATSLYRTLRCVRGP